ncbi:MAG: TlpA family protein disulfide reductase [Gemmataceae bacterium]
MYGNTGKLVLIAALAAILFGCMDAKPPSSTAPGDKVELILATTQEIVAKIEAAKGKIVVVDVWASWCPPCREEFPNLLILDRDLGKQGVVCMSVSIDSSQKHKAALEFLKEVGSTILNYRVADNEVWGNKFNIEGIPDILIFENGKLLNKFHTYKEATPYVKSLLAKKTTT